LFAGAFAVAVSGAAHANPIMVVNEVNVEQFWGTPHVQITGNYSNGGPMTTSVSRDGTSLAVSFDTAPGESRNLGSGAASVYTVVGCDCAVPAGRHDYVVANHAVSLDVVEPSATPGPVRMPSAQCDVKCAGSVNPSATGGTTSTVGGSSSSVTGGTGGFTATGGTTTTLLGSGGLTTTGGTANSTSASVAVVVNGGFTATGGVSTNATLASLASGGSIATSGASANASNPRDVGQKSGGESSGCSFSRSTGCLLPVGMLVALGLLAFRRRK